MNIDLKISRKCLGFTLIEVMVALIVVAVGLLALASFQGELFSTSSGSKARAEAVSIANTRLEELRADLLSQDISQETAENWYTTYITNSSETIDGNNAVFTLAYDIEAVTQEDDGTGTIVPTTKSFAELKTAMDAGTNIEVDELLVMMTVTWPGNDLPVEVETKVSYTPDTLASGVVAGSSGVRTYINSPTGRARIGEGNLSDKGLKDSDITDFKDKFKDKDSDGFADGDKWGDGVEEYRNIVDGELSDVWLADESGNVVLTLEEACITDGECTGFSSITGKFYVDASKFDETFMSGAAENIFLRASDAAFCTFYYGVTTDPDDATKLIPDANLADIAAGSIRYSAGDGNEGAKNDTNPMAAPFLSKKAAPKSGGDPAIGYEYLNYRCYVGAGWYGNIGLILSTDPNFDDRMCIGDPTDIDISSGTPVAGPDSPRLALRRSYRGEQFYDANADTVASSDEDVEPKASIGIRDAIEITGHDLVYTYTVGQTQTSGGICWTTESGWGGKSNVTPSLVRDDAWYDHDNDDTNDDVNIFAGVPGTFVCLNDDNNDDGEPDYDTYVDSLLTYKDTGTKYTPSSFCAYDPTDQGDTVWTMSITATLPSYYFFRNEDPATPEDEPDTLIEAFEKETDPAVLSLLDGDGEISKMAFFDILFATRTIDTNEEKFDSGECIIQKLVDDGDTATATYLCYGYVWHLPPDSPQYNVADTYWNGNVYSQWQALDNFTTTGNYSSLYVDGTSTLDLADTVCTPTSIPVSDYNDDGSTAIGNFACSPGVSITVSGDLCTTKSANAVSGAKIVNIADNTNYYSCSTVQPTKNNPGSYKCSIGLPTGSSLLANEWNLVFTWNDLKLASANVVDNQTTNYFDVANNVDVDGVGGTSTVPLIKTIDSSISISGVDVKSGNCTF